MSKLTKILQEIIEFNAKTPCWIVSSEVGDLLYKKACEINAKKILEIGTSIGYSALHFAKALKETKGFLYTIESHKERFQLAKNFFKKSGLSKYIIQIKGHAPEVIPKIKGKWDLVFFDATKCEHIFYFNAVKNKIKKNGLLIVDNVQSHKKAMENFLKKISKDENFETKIYTQIDKGLLIAKKL